MNKTKTSIVKRVALASALLIGCAAVAPAFAGHVSLNIGVGLPVYGGYYAAPAPVVYAPPPPPVYYAPAPVVYAPAPVVYPAATVVVGGHPGYYHRGGYYYRGGYRYYGH
ncbi:hypothetical protein SAMN04487785_11472 [Dyella jiangningensis]|uniref:hypothetical protein n=1 Tax=Dyella sp. AtDHG13 TaxID=1938897 RepID=UPI000882A564|nr:hypothetical protein [Dyella sp. AtDHG13]PXV54150.1 hypothetical protein BDW41_113102 [Dyella sp. AtDHG13]SDL06176.1 hypothetical protein SAMN04487785_11472 [Dyella jiangningensis]